MPPFGARLRPILHTERAFLTNETTFHPGIGADEAMAELHGLIGQITSNWAEVEDGLFHLFVTALAGTWSVGDLRPYRSVFFTFNSYEQKMRMLNNAMKARYGDDETPRAGNTASARRLARKGREVKSSAKKVCADTISTEWKALKKALDDFADLRNTIAHLIPKAKSSTDPTGYSIDQLRQALAPYWGYHPRISLNPPGGATNHQLSYRLQQFAMKLQPAPPSAP
jgi:hypothetical protein